MVSKFIITKEDVESIDHIKLCHSIAATNLSQVKEGLDYKGDKEINVKH